MPCAHAPALSPLPLDPHLDPRAAGEELGYSFLACVLVGLSRAPSLLPLTDAGTGLHRRSMFSDLIFADQLGAVVVPAGALGGEAVLACLERGVPLITVQNPGVMAVTPALLGLGSSVLKANSYAEAAGLVLALREGIEPAALSRPLPDLKRI